MSLRVGFKGQLVIYSILAVIVFGSMYGLSDWADRAESEPVDMEGPGWNIKRDYYTNLHHHFRVRRASGDWHFQFDPRQMIGVSYAATTFWRPLYNPVIELQVPSEDGVRAVFTVGIFPDRGTTNSLNLAEDMVNAFTAEFSADSTFRVLRSPTLSEVYEVKGAYTVIKLPDARDEVQLFVFTRYQENFYVLSGIADVAGYDFYLSDFADMIESFWFTVE